MTNPLNYLKKIDGKIICHQESAEIRLVFFISSR